MNNVNASHSSTHSAAETLRNNEKLSVNADEYENILSDNKGSKRTRENYLQRSLIGNLSKTPRLSDSPLRMMQLLDDRFSKLTERLEQRFEDRLKSLLRENNNTLLNELDKRICDLRIDLENVSERVSRIEAVVDDVNLLKSEIRELKLQHLRQENSIVAADLRIIGIPYVENEDLKKIFYNICQNFNIPVPDLRSIHRLKNRNNTKQGNSPDAVIIATLMSPYDKNFFLKNLSVYKKSNNNILSLNEIGFDSNSRFYINENLSNTNYYIFQQAMGLKKKKILQTVYTFKGLVYVKPGLNDDPICIEDVNALDGFRPCDQEMHDQQRNISE